MSASASPLRRRALRALAVVGAVPCFAVPLPRAGILRGMQVSPAPDEHQPIPASVVRHSGKSPARRDVRVSVELCPPRAIPGPQIVEVARAAWLAAPAEHHDPTSFRIVRDRVVVSRRRSGRVYPRPRTAVPLPGLVAGAPPAERHDALAPSV